MSRQNVFRPIAFGQLPSGQLSFGQLPFGLLPAAQILAKWWDWPTAFRPNNSRTNVMELSVIVHLSTSQKFLLSSCFLLICSSNKISMRVRTKMIWCYQKKTDKDFFISIKINQTRWIQKTTGEAPKKFQWSTSDGFQWPSWRYNLTHSSWNGVELQWSKQRYWKMVGPQAKVKKWKLDWMTSQPRHNFRATQADSKSSGWNYSSDLLHSPSSYSHLLYQASKASPWLDLEVGNSYQQTADKEPFSANLSKP